MSESADRDKLLNFFAEASEIPGISRLDVTTDRGVTYTFGTSGAHLALKIEAFSDPIQLDEQRLRFDPGYFQELTRAPRTLYAVAELLDDRPGIFRLLERKAELMGRRYPHGSAGQVQG